MPFITSLSASSLMGWACKWNVSECSMQELRQQVCARLSVGVGGRVKKGALVGGALSTFRSHVGPYYHWPVN